MLYRIESFYSLLIFFSILPESPRWLISKGHYDKAEKILCRIAKTNKNTFDSIAYQRLVTAEKKVINYNRKKKHPIFDYFLFVRELLQKKVMDVCTYFNQK